MTLAASGMTCSPLRCLTSEGSDAVDVSIARLALLSVRRGAPHVEPKLCLISPQPQPRPPTLLNAIGKTSISVGWRVTFGLKEASMNTQSNMTRNESELGG